MNTSRKVYYDYVHVHEWVSNIVRQMYKDNWRPEYIVGLTRGGLVPAVILSHYIDVPMHTLEVKLRDHANTESNLWMADDAYDGVNILVVDDINDTGATLEWITKDWPLSCYPKDEQWSRVWSNNVRFATLIDNLSSKFPYKINYTGKEINKAEDDIWINFPWEGSNGISYQN